MAFPFGVKFLKYLFLKGEMNCPRQRRHGVLGRGEDMAEHTGCDMLYKAEEMCRDTAYMAEER